MSEIKTVDDLVHRLTFIAINLRGSLRQSGHVIENLSKFNACDSSNYHHHAGRCEALEFALEKINRAIEAYDTNKND